MNAHPHNHPSSPKASPARTVLPSIIPLFYFEVCPVGKGLPGPACSTVLRRRPGPLPLDAHPNTRASGSSS